MHGVAAETRLPEKAYRPGVSQRVYRQIAWRTQLILAEGGSVVADAVFDKSEDRDNIERIASEANVRFAGFWLVADPSVLWCRVKERKGGPSDATVDILSRQLQRDPGTLSWHKIEADRTVAEITAKMVTSIEGTASSGVRLREDRIIELTGA
jgi:predicted kinase